MNERVYRAALLYLDAGISVIPIRADGSKAPVIHWKRYQDQRATESLLRKWFLDANEERGLAILGGAISGNLEIIDFDDYGAFAQLCEDNCISALLESIPLVETPSGGRHLYLRCEEPVEGNTKLAMGEGRKKTLIETRGEGGYVLAPPCPPACHEANLPYKFLRGRPSTIPLLSAVVVRRLHTLCSWFDHQEEIEHAARVAEAARKPQPQGNYRPYGSGEILPGQWYNTHGDVLTLLIRHGWKPVGREGENLKLQRPGKTGKGVSATWNERIRRLYVFSTNASPFTSGRAYAPLGVYGLLECRGDWAEAAREIRANFMRQ